MEGDIADEGRLSPLNDQHFQELVPSLFQALTKNSIGCAPFVLSICLLALLQLLEGRGKSTDFPVIAACPFIANANKILVPK